ncbi:MAG: hypothetical protein IPP68_04960 [Elusimicrobia bacterium]|nr:hypothetical protein [Elusimicrobiota bacterium]
MNIDELRKRVLKAGMDEGTVISYGADPLTKHAGRVGTDAGPWLDALFDFVSILHTQKISLWSPLHFTIEPLAKASGGDAGLFVDLLDATRDLLMDLRDQGIDTTRTEQYGVGIAAAAFEGDGLNLIRALRFARQLAGQKQDPGWFLQLTLPAMKNGPGFEQRLNGLTAFLAPLLERGAFIPYPLAVGLESVAKILPNSGDWAKALDLLGVLVKTLDAPRVVTLFRGGLEELQNLSIPPENLMRGLTVAVALADRGVDPAPTLRRACLFSESLAVAEKLAAEGSDPAPVLAGDFRVYDSLGLLAKGGERLIGLALALKTRRGKGERFFEEAIPCVAALEAKLPGLGEDLLGFSELMIDRGLDPTMAILFGFPRALSAEPAPPGLRASVLEFARTLAGASADPTAALRFAIRPLAVLAGAHGDRFRDLLAGITRLILSLEKKGADVQDTLFHDIQRMAEEGATSDVFIVFLRRLERVFDLWMARGADLAALAERGLPVLAQESVGKPWLVDIVFDRLEEWGRLDKTPQALGMLEHGLAVAARAGGTGPDLFREALAVMERSLARLPAELAAVAPPAACALAGGDAAKLEPILRAVADHAPSPVPPALIEALPLLSRLADDAASLGSLIDLSLSLADGLPEDRREAWWRGGLEAAARIAEGQPRAAERFLTELAGRARAWTRRAGWLLEKATGVFAAGLNSTDDVLKALDALVAEIEALGDDEATLSVVLSLGAAAKSLQGVRERLAVLRKAIRPAQERSALVNGLADVLGPVERCGGLWPEVVAPTLARQGGHAGALLRWIAGLADQYLDTTENRAAFMEIVAQRGVRAADAVKNLVAPALHRGEVASLAADRKILIDYFNDIGFHNVSIFSRYRSIVAEKDTPRSEKKRRVEDLGREITGLADGLRRGQLTAEEEKSPLLGVALQYLFPPATSASTRDYEDLFQRFEDRPQDLSPLKDNGAAKYEFSVSGGEWRFLPDAAVDLEVWRPFVPAPEAAVPRQTPEAEGWELLGAWTQGLLGRPDHQKEFLPVLARRAGGGARAADLNSPDALIALRDFAANRVRDYVEEVLLAAKASDGSRYERLVRGKLAPAAGVGKALVKGVAATLDAFREKKLTRQDAVERLGRQLQDFEWTQPDALLGAESREAVEDILSRLPAKVLPLNAGVEVERVHQELTGQALRHMRRILHGTDGRSGCLEFVPSAGARKLTMEVTKRRAHAAVGYCEGVCVAGDRILWNKPHFWQAVIWGDNGVCAGGAHVLVVEDADGTYVALPGINPGQDLLSETSPELVLDRVTEFAWRLAKALGARGVWVPTAGYIHSNRRGIQDAIAAKQWPVRTCRDHAFSEAPYRYSFSEVFDVPPPAPGAV